MTSVRKMEALNCTRGAKQADMTFEFRTRHTHRMSRRLTTRKPSALLLSVLLGAGAAVAQAPVGGFSGSVSTLPPSQPTSSTPQTVPNQPPAATPKYGTRLDIVFNSGSLTVDATNASLNQLIRDVAQKTGMKVTGNVSEEKVFGHYGPSPVSEVLASLLDGTGSNMLLVDNQNGPSELVLTPRRGGATPPSPNASIANNSSRDDQPEQQYVPPTRPFQPPVALGRGPVGANPDGTPAFSPPTQNPNSGDASASDSSRSPQQIYEQLQSLGAQHPQNPEQ